MPLCALARENALTAGMITIGHGEPTGRCRHQEHAIKRATYWPHRTSLYEADMTANNGR